MERAQAPDRQRVLVAIPAFNEELTIIGVVVRSQPFGDVVVVDDGSSDRTAEFGRLAGAIVLRNRANEGKGAAIRVALNFAASNGYDALVFLDGDGQHDPAEIPLLLAPLQRPTNPADLVLGTREGKPSGMPGYRHVGKAVLDFATSMASASQVVDSQCGFRALGKKAIHVMLSDLTSSGFEVESEMVIVAQRANLTLESVPVTVTYAGVDGSTQNPVVHATRVLDRIIFFIAIRRPLLMMGLPGLASIVFGAFWGLRMLKAYQADRVFVTSYGLAAATFTILGGILLASALMLNVMVLAREHFARRT